MRFLVTRTSWPCAAELLQRIEPTHYRTSVIKVINHRLLSLSALIRSKGFRPYFGWMLSLCRDALVFERDSADLQYRKMKLMVSATSGDDQVVIQRDVISSYLASIKRLLAMANKNYNAYVNPVWGKLNRC